jgi:GGDEF domain-containing protein
MLRTSLEQMLPTLESFSLLLLHIAQFEHVQLPPTSAVIRQRVSYHASANLQEQILHNIRRTLRADDQILADEQGTGAAILFPEVDQEGIARIAERISRSINLLQAETVVPPLQYETEIVSGFASYPSPARTLEELLYHSGQIQERIVFRPAVISQRPCTPMRTSRSEDLVRKSRSKETRLLKAHANSIPFMQIPSRLPTRLKQLIPYSLAVKLRCAPVGRNHNQLTVAMANPMDTQALGLLREATGMTIFPVSCEIAALDILLASDW